MNLKKTLQKISVIYSLTLIIILIVNLFNLYPKLNIGVFFIYTYFLFFFFLIKNFFKEKKENFIKTSNLLISSIKKIDRKKTFYISLILIILFFILDLIKNKYPLIVNYTNLISFKYIEFALNFNKFLFFLTFSIYFFNSFFDLKNCLKEKEKKENSHREHYFWGILIIIISFLIRIININKIPLSGDEGIYPLIVEGIKKLGYPSFIKTGYIYQRSYLFSYITFIFNLLIKNQNLSLRITSLLSSLILSIVVFVNIKKINKKSAILAIFLIGTSPFFIAWSKIARFYMFGILISFIEMIIIFKNLEKNKTNFSNNLLLIISIIISFTNFDFLYFIPISICIYLTIINSSFNWLKNKKTKLILVIISLSIITNKFSGYIFNRNIENINNLGKEILSFFGNEWFKNFIYYNLIIIYQNVFIIVILLFLIIKLFFIKKKKLEIKYKNYFLYLLINFFVTYVFSFAFMSRVHIRYFLLSDFLFKIVISYLIFEIESNINSVKNKLLIYLLIILNLPFSLTPIHFKNSSFPRQFFDAKINYKTYSYMLKEPYKFHSMTAVIGSPRYSEAISFIKNNKKESDIYICNETYNTFTYLEQDFILNEYLSNYMSYSPNNKNEKLSIYTGTEFIYKKEQLTNLMKENKKIWFMADYRWKIHNPNIYKLIEENFSLEFQTKSDSVGKIYDIENFEIKVFLFSPEI